MKELGDICFWFVSSVEIEAVGERPVYCPSECNGFDTKCKFYVSNEIKDDKNSSK